MRKSDKWSVPTLKQYQYFYFVLKIIFGMSWISQMTTSITDTRLIPINRPRVPPRLGKTKLPFIQEKRK